MESGMRAIMWSVCLWRVGETCFQRVKKVRFSPDANVFFVLTYWTLLLLFSVFLFPRKNITTKTTPASFSLKSVLDNQILNVNWLLWNSFALYQDKWGTEKEREYGFNCGKRQGRRRSWNENSGLNLNKIASGTWNFVIWKTEAGARSVCQNASEV